MHQDGLAHLLSLVPNHEAEKYSLVCKQWYYLVNHELRVRRNNFGMSVDSLVWKPFNTKNMPSSRFSATMKPHPFKPSTLILFGGESDPIKYYNDVYFLDLATMTWELVITSGEQPKPRGFPSLDFIKFKDTWYMITFGGQFRTSIVQWIFYNDTYILNLETFQWIKLGTLGDPPACVGHRTCILDRKLWSFGGTSCSGAWNQYTYYNDLYYLNLDSLIWHKIVPTGEIPCKRQSSTLNKLNDHQIILVAGNSDVNNRKSGNLNDVWIYDIRLNKWYEVKMKNKELFPVNWCHTTFVLNESCILVIPGWHIEKPLPMSKLYIGNLSILYYFLKTKIQDELMWKEIEIENAPHARLFFSCSHYIDTLYFCLGAETMPDHNVLKLTWA